MADEFELPRVTCTHCHCKITSRLMVWVHVHSGLHQCDGGIDIAVPIMDARGRIIRTDVEIRRQS